MRPSPSLGGVVLGKRDQPSGLVVGMRRVCLVLISITSILFTGFFMEVQRWNILSATTVTIPGVQSYKPRIAENCTNRASRKTENLVLAHLKTMPSVEHMVRILEGCGEICNTSAAVFNTGLATNPPLPLLKKHVDCRALWSNTVLDEPAQAVVHDIPKEILPISLGVPNPIF